MTNDEAKLIALGVCLGVLMTIVLPAKIVPLCMALIVAYVNRKDLMRAFRKMRK